ncbi:MAG: hypothetical protein HYU66_09040 [Armatimonadetes bacterium]|nr:hypothetical protein [Armatimonadota bacterium]
MQRHRLDLIVAALVALATSTGGLCASKPAYPYTFTLLGSLPGSKLSMAFGVNSSAHVVGLADSRDGQRAFYWVAGMGMLDFGPGRAEAISEDDWVVGEGPSGAFVWCPGMASELDLNTVKLDANSLTAADLGWELMTAWAINGTHQVVGMAKHYGVYNHGYLLTLDADPTTGRPAGTGTLVDLVYEASLQIENVVYAFGMAINGGGQVAGSMRSDTLGGFLYADGLFDRFPVTGLVIRDLNDRGEMVSESSYWNGQSTDANGNPVWVSPFPGSPGGLRINNQSPATVVTRSSYVWKANATGTGATHLSTLVDTSGWQLFNGGGVDVSDAGHIVGDCNKPPGYPGQYAYLLTPK